MVSSRLIKDKWISIQRVKGNPHLLENKFNYVSAIMEDFANTLLGTLEQLQHAIDNADWLAASKLDEQIKQTLSDIIQETNVKEDKDKEWLMSLLVQVQSVYNLLQENTEEARKQISIELKKLTQDKRVSDFYQKASTYK